MAKPSSSSRKSIRAGGGDKKTTLLHSFQEDWLGWLTMSGDGVPIGQKVREQREKEVSAEIEREEASLCSNLLQIDVRLSRFVDGAIPSLEQYLDNRDGSGLAFSPSYPADICRSTSGKRTSSDIEKSAVQRVMSLPSFGRLSRIANEQDVAIAVSYGGWYQPKYYGQWENGNNKSDANSHLSLSSISLEPLKPFGESAHYFGRTYAGRPRKKVRAEMLADRVNLVELYSDYRIIRTRDGDERWLLHD